MLCGFPTRSLQSAVLSFPSHLSTVVETGMFLSYDPFVFIIIVYLKTHYVLNVICTIQCLLLLAFMAVVLLVFSRLWKSRYFYFFINSAL
jgi:hypothetical protein